MLRMIVLLAAAPALAQPKLPEAPPLSGPQPILKPWARGLTLPVGLYAAPNDPVARRMYVVEKIGRVRAIRDGLVEEAAFLDVSDRISSATEQGLLGLAFHPKYAENGRVFVYYTDKRGDIRVVEYRVKRNAPGRVDPASARELLHIDHHKHNNHDGGQLVFGPDGKLWLGPGDGGSRRNRDRIRGRSLSKLRENGEQT